MDMNLCKVWGIMKCREPAWRIPPMAKVIRKRPDGQRRDQASRDPLDLLEHLPKSRICLTILCLSPTLLTLTVGYSQPPFSGENQLRALAKKSPGHERNLSNSTPLCWHSSLSDRYIQTLAAMHVIVHSLPAARSTGSLKHSKNIEPFKELQIIRVVLV